MLVSVGGVTLHVEQRWVLSPISRTLFVYLLHHLLACILPFVQRRRALVVQRMEVGFIRHAVMAAWFVGYCPAPVDSLRSRYCISDPISVMLSTGVASTPPIVSFIRPLSCCIYLVWRSSVHCSGHCCSSDMPGVAVDWCVYIVVWLPNVECYHFSYASMGFTDHSCVIILSTTTAPC